MKHLYRSVRLVAVLASLFLVGCAALTTPGEDSVWSRVPEGASIRVEQRLPIAPGRTRVWLRGDGTSSSSSSGRPICGLEVRGLDREAVQFIEPGVFEVTRVQNMWTQVVRMPAEPGVRFRLAGMDGGGSGGTPMIYEGYHLWLENPEQPGVMRMTCIGVFADMWEARPPTVADIRASLGSLATLELPAVP